MLNFIRLIGTYDKKAAGLCLQILAVQVPGGLERLMPKIERIASFMVAKKMIR